jgi:hypothetical protein
VKLNSNESTRGSHDPSLTARGRELEESEMSEQQPDYSRMDETEEDRINAARVPTRIGPTTFKLMNGLEINFASDGTWLAFKDSRGNSSVIRLENIAAANGHIIGTPIQKWSEDRRSELEP